VLDYFNLNYFNSLEKKLFWPEIHVLKVNQVSKMPSWHKHKCEILLDHITSASFAGKINELSNH